MRPEGAWRYKQKLGSSKMDDLFDDSPFLREEDKEKSAPEPAQDPKQQISFEIPVDTEAAPKPTPEPEPEVDQVCEEGDKDEHDDRDDTDEDDGGEPVAKERMTPHDDIKVSVKSFKATSDDFIFDVEVNVNGQTKMVQRSYKDLQWLHRNLARRMELGGYILPPMPAPPPKSTDPKLVILGENTKAMFGDVTRLPCIAVEQFMQALADHRFFSENDTVHTYVANDELSERDKLGTGTLWNSITKVVSDFQLGKIEDTDEDFQKFLEYLNKLTPDLVECTQAHSKMVGSQDSLACSQAFIAELMKEHSTFESLKNRVCSDSFQKLGEGLEEEKQCVHSSSLDGRHTIGMTFDLYHRYCIQAKEMLYRRLSKLQKLLTCTTKLDKAKPEKKQEAEEARERADKEFQEISEIARKEIDLFKQKYVEFFRSNLIGYAESQLAHSRQGYENIAKLRDQLVQEK